MKDNLFDGNLIIGREFLQTQKLTFEYKPLVSEENVRVSLFSFLPLYISERQKQIGMSEIIEETEIDFDEETRACLKDTVKEAMNTQITYARDDYNVRVHLKDPSVYSYAPRKFAHAERVEMRKIIDELIETDVVQPSISPYCARVVLVRKRNGSLRLCVDLRPLNCRVEKQKYPFPIIEDCLARLSKSKK